MQVLSAIFLLLLMIAKPSLHAQGMTPSMDLLMSAHAEEELAHMHSEEYKALQWIVINLLWQEGEVDLALMKDRLDSLALKQKNLAEQTVHYPASLVRQLNDKARPANMAAYVNIQQWCTKHPEQGECVELMLAILPQGMPSEAERLALRDEVVALVAQSLSLVKQTRETLAKVIDTASADAHAAAFTELLRASQELDSKIAAIDGQWFTTDDLQRINQSEAYISAYIKMMMDIQRINEAQCFNSKPLKEAFAYAGVK